MQTPVKPFSSQPRTLGEARTEISRLKEQLKIKMGLGASPSPALATSLPSIPSLPDLGGLPPAALSNFFANSTTPHLREALSRETSRDRKHQDPRIIAQIYRELKKRKL